jgi:hypothetical protein
MILREACADPGLHRAALAAYRPEHPPGYEVERPRAARQRHPGTLIPEPRRQVEDPMKRLPIAAPAAFAAGEARLPEPSGPTGRGGGDLPAGVPPTFLPRIVAGHAPFTT